MDLVLISGLVILAILWVLFYTTLHLPLRFRDRYAKQGILSMPFHVLKGNVVEFAEGTKIDDPFLAARSVVVRQLPLVGCAV